MFLIAFKHALKRRTYKNMTQKVDKQLVKEFFTLAFHTQYILLYKNMIKKGVYKTKT